MAFYSGSTTTGTNLKSDKTGFPVGTSDPSSNVEAGDMYYNSNSQKFRIYNGLGWFNVGTDASAVYNTSGLIFDLDFGRLSGSYSDGAGISDGTSLASSLLYTHINNQTSGVTVAVNGGSCNYGTSEGGHITTYSNTCRITVGGGGSPTAIGGNNGLLDTVSMSIEGWYMYHGSGRDVLVSRFGGGYGEQFNHIVDPGGQFHFNSSGVGCGGGNVDWNAFGDNVWFHAVWMYDGPSTVHRWYTNGSLAGTWSGGDGSLETDNGNGFSLFSRSDRYEDLTGKIAIVRFYNRALSASDITSNYNAEKSRFGH